VVSSYSAPPAAPGAPSRQGFSLLNDEPLADRTQDLLSAYQAAGSLTRLLTDSRAATPFTLAVDAGWGMGKSSLMRLVDARLREFPEIRTVWYNAWSSTGPDALEGLIKSVLAQVDRNVLRRWVRRMRDGGALTTFLRALTVLVAGPLGVSGMVDELWRRLSADAGARNGMRDALRGLVGEWTSAVSGDRSRLLVVFIDDLDRCGEDTFLAVCEAVKVYLDVPGLAFVIGVDRSAIGAGGLLRDLSPAGAAFAEKIFQTSYRIPAPSGPDIRTYVRSCARQAGIDAMLDDHLVELLAYRAARNPRRVKRLVNGLLLEASLNPIWAGVRSEAVIRTLLLQYLYPDFYRMMTTPAGPGDGDVVREFRTYRSVRGHLWNGEPWNTGVTREVSGFLRAYSLPPLPSFPPDPGARPRTLTTLEQQLPTDFPGLANDPAFVSLVDELVALPESRLVLRRLREGVDQPLEATPYEPAPGYVPTPPPPYGVGNPYGPGHPYGSPYPSPYTSPYAYPPPQGAYGDAGRSGGTPSADDAGNGGPPAGYGSPQGPYGYPQPATPSPWSPPADRGRAAEPPRAQPERPGAAEPQEQPADPPGPDPRVAPSGSPYAAPQTTPAAEGDADEDGDGDAVAQEAEEAEESSYAGDADGGPRTPPRTGEGPFDTDQGPPGSYLSDDGPRARPDGAGEPWRPPEPEEFGPRDPYPAQPGPYLPQQGSYPQPAGDPAGWQPAPQGPSGPARESVPPAYGAPVSPALEEGGDPAVLSGPVPPWYGQKPRSARPQTPQTPVEPGSALPVQLIGFGPAPTARLTDELGRLGLLVLFDGVASSLPTPGPDLVNACRLDMVDSATVMRVADMRRRLPAEDLPGLVLYSPRLTPSLEVIAGTMRAELTDDLGRVVEAAYTLAVQGPGTSAPYRPGSASPEPSPFSSPYPPRVRRTERPGSSPVRRPSSMTNRPSTSTYGMPVGRVRGRS
jgi:hypothetical protein